MKHLVVVFVALLGATSHGFAKKTFHEVVALTADQEIVVHLNYADKVSFIPMAVAPDAGGSGAGGKLEIKGEISVNDGENDASYHLNVTTQDGQVVIKSELDDQNKKHYRIVQKFDEDGNLIATYHSIEIRGWFEIYVPEGVKISAKTINADLSFSSVLAPIKAESINGEIEVVMPDSADVDVKVSTINGECYTNLDFAFRDEHRRQFRKIGGAKTEVRLNQGGVQIDLKTINGIMYLLSKESRVNAGGSLSAGNAMY